MFSESLRQSPTAEHSVSKRSIGTHGGIGSVTHVGDVRFPRGSHRPKVFVFAHDVKHGSGVGDTDFKSAIFSTETFTALHRISAFQAKEGFSFPGVPIDVKRKLSERVRDNI